MDRMQEEMTLPMLMSTLSPSRWPQVSLYFLKKSMSRISRERSGVPLITLDLLLDLMEELPGVVKAGEGVGDGQLLHFSPGAGPAPV